MLNFFSQLLEKEAYRHPLTFVLCLISAGFAWGMLANPFAMASDLEVFQEETRTEQRKTRDEMEKMSIRMGGVEAGLCGVQYTLEKNGLESALRDAATGISQLERAEEAGEATARDIKRLDELRSEQNLVQRELQILERRVNCSVKQQ